MNDADPQIILRWYRIPGVTTGPHARCDRWTAARAARSRATGRADRPHAVGSTPALSPRNASYASTRASTPASRTITGDEVAHVAQHDVTRRDHAPVPPLLQRLAQRSLDVDARAAAGRAVGHDGRRDRRTGRSIDISNVTIVSGGSAAAT